MIEDIKKTLWATADKLRANMDAAEYKHIVLGLIFVKYISDTFQTRRAELLYKFADREDDYYLEDADTDTLNAELEDRDYYKEANVFWVPEAARWENLRAQAKQADIGKRIDDALSLIETENPKLKGIQGEVLFIDARKLGSMISRVQCEFTDDVIARIANTVAAWRGEGGAGEDYADSAGFCRSVTLAEIAEHGHVLTPGRYVGAEAVEEDDEVFAEKMQKLTEKLGEQMAKGAELDQLIRQKLGGLGYEF